MLLLFVSGASAFAGPRLTASEALRIADAEVRRRGYDVRKFKRPTPRYNYVYRDDTWWIYYEPRRQMRSPGDDFSVTVKDRTRKAWLNPGE
jgi:hypothetical protein